MKHNKKFIENIDKLLDSTSLEDVKLGILLYCNSSSFQQIRNKFNKRKNNLSSNATSGHNFPEHAYSKRSAIVILTGRFAIMPSLEYSKDYKSPDRNLEFF